MSGVNNGNIDMEIEMNEVLLRWWELKDIKLYLIRIICVEGMFGWNICLFGIKLGLEIFMNFILIFMD